MDLKNQNITLGLNIFNFMKSGIEWQVCKLEFSKQFKELGVKQKSLFWWVNDGKALGESSERWVCVYHRWTTDIPTHPDKVSAFTVAELGEMLPVRSSSWRQLNGLWVADYFWKSGNGLPADKFQMDTEANARAAMLIYLLENKLIDVNHLN